ncbi:hypothetical protein Bca4012_023576 [Brassica carinata]|uniref:Uncharacterized protein n=1 Tax=Brassica carinata TaxID=52824 RepID=A0A8X7TFD8_BRACI|nr:hypothetical protein Bca52824_091511 [Brassica carinata]
MSESNNSSSGSNQFYDEFSALREANVQLGLRIRTKVQEMGEFNKKTTTSKDALIASITCIGKCIDSLESALTKNRVVIHRRVNPPMLVRISKDLTNDTLRSNAKLLLDHFKEHTLQYFYNAFFPPVTAPDDEVVRKFAIFRSHLEKCESLFDRVMM